MNYQLVVFDIAGTTVYDAGNVGNAYVSAFESHKVPVPLPEVKRVMGYKKKDAVRMLLLKFHPRTLLRSDEIVDVVHDTFIGELIKHYKTDQRLRPMPHAEEIFKLLRESGIKVALNTGFTRAVTNVILERLGWLAKKQADAIITSDEVSRGRPDPDMIYAIMKELGIIESSKVVKVGDTEVDVLEGRNAGCGLVVSVTTGAGLRQQLQACRPDHIIDSLEELPSLIELA